LMGSSLPNPAGIFPFEHFRITIEVAKYIFSQDLFMGVSSAPTVYWAEMYANFGVLGVIFSSMLVGICFFALSLVLQKLPMSIPAIIAIISISMICKELSTTGITHLLFSADLFFIIIVSAILFFLNQNWKNKSLLQTKILGRVHQE